MGFLDQLKKVADGVGDIFTAPVGLVVDTARAITSEEYNPGFFGTFGAATEQAVTGLSKVGEGVGARAAGQFLGETTLGPVLRGMFDQAELIYSSEFQTQTGRTPFGIESTPFGTLQPGQASLQRFGAAGLGAVGESLATGQPDFHRQWQRSAHRTPGQAWVEELVGFYDRPPEEQDLIKDTAWYNLSSGTIDAVGRWFTDPGVLGGKGIRTVRRRLAFQPGVTDVNMTARRAGGHKAAVKKLGYQIAEETDPVDGMPMLRLKPGRNQSTYTVVRNSMLQEFDTGDADGAVRERLQIGFPEQDVDEVRTFLRDQGVPEEQLDTLVDETLRLQAMEEVNVDSAGRGIFGEAVGEPTGVKFPGTSYRPLQLIAGDNIDEARRYASALYQQDPSDMPVIVRLNADGLRVGFEEIDMPHIPDGKRPQDAAFFTLADEIDADQIDEVMRLDPDELDPALAREPIPAGQAVKQWNDLDDDQLIEVYHATDPDTAARLSEEGVIAANKPPRDPRLSTGTGSGTPGLFVVADGERLKKLSYGSPTSDSPNQVIAVTVRKGDLDVPPEAAQKSALPPDVPQSLQFTNIGAVIKGDVPSSRIRFLDEPRPRPPSEPATALNPRFYNPDGRPVEPDQIIPFEELRDDLLTANRLASEQSPVEAEKFLLARQRQRNGRSAQGENFAQKASQHKQFQAYINWMDGKSTDEIRRVLFPNTPYGDVISAWLAQADNYAERRTILLASMGYKLDDYGTLGEVMRAKLDKLAEEGERLARGEPPDQMVNALLELPSKYGDDVSLHRPDLIQEMIGELEDQARYNRFLDRVSTEAPVRQLQLPVMRRATNVVRRTSWYQETPLARPIRNVVENRPHQWVNVQDSMSDIQLVRQLEEAQPLGIAKETIEDFRERYAFASEAERVKIIEEANEHIIEMAARKSDMSFEEFEGAINAARQGNAQVKDFLRSRRYASGDRDLFEFIDPDTGELTRVRLPVLETQLQSWIPMPNAREIVKLANKMGKIKGRIGGIPTELMDQFYRYWKPTVLLRGGWMLRVVSDEQLRILAKHGSLLTHLAAISTGETPKFTHIADSDISFGRRAAATLATVTGTQPMTSVAVRAAKGITSVARKAGLIDEDQLRIMQDVGNEGLVSARASFGGAPEQSIRDLSALMGRDELMILDHLRDKPTGQWRSVVKGEREYAGAWSRVLAEQYGRSPLARTITQEIIERGRFGVEYLDDAELNTVVQNTKRWLRNTAEGKEIAERVPWAARDPEKWITELVEEINGYTAGFDEDLLRGILKQKVTREMMENIDEAWRPDTVHGEIVSQSLGTSVITETLNEFISEGFDLLGRLPTDTLSRQPMFKALYSGEIQRLRKLREAQGLDVADESAIARMDKSARQYAIRETRDLLYDLAEVSRFGSMMRQIMPFYPAWQEVLTVWGKLAIEDPSVIARGKILWEAPNKANIVHTDDEGEEWIQLRLSEQSADKLDLTGWKRYLATGGLRFGKSSFNLVLNSPLPGVGPLIQIPVNEVVKNKPELEESIRWLLPFGASTDSAKMLFSPLLRQLGSEIQGAESDQSYQRAFVDALTWMDVEHRAGRRTAPPTYDEAHDVASKLFTTRLVLRLGAPAQPIFDSPLQPYFDAYRDMIENLGPEEAHEAFLNEFGSEFFAVTMSRTVSETGIPPTVEAEVARRNYEELIQKHPEYGRLIIGDSALGEFSTAAFAAQLERPTDPDNPFSDPERTYRPVELDPRTGKIMEVDRRLGWQEYISALDQIDLARRQLGLPNLRVAEAEHLADAKRAVTEFLRRKYPSWYDDFNTQDRLKWDRRLDAFKDLTNDRVLQTRPDIQGLEVYLEARQAILQELNRRKTLGGASTLDATSNQDLATLWETTVFQILEDNVAFGPLYYRYLEGDPVRLNGS